VGEFGFNQYQLKAGGDTGRLNYLLNVSRMEFDGYRAFSETKNTLVNARFSYAIDDESELGVIVNTTNQPFANDPGGISLAQAQADPTSAWPNNVNFRAGESLDQQRLGLTYSKSFGERHEIQLRNHYVWRDFANLLPFAGGGATEFERFYVGGGANYSYHGEAWGRPNNLIVGIDIDHQDDGRQRYDNNMGTLGSLLADQDELVTNVGLFVQDEMALTDELTLTVGLRYDEIEYEVKDKFLSDGNDSASRSLDEVSPMIGVVYSPFEAASFYATITTAFEAPTTVELANPDATGGFNPNIQPQLATNYEVGVKGTIARRNRFEVSLFSIDVKDELILFDLGGREFYQNAGQSSRRGAEFSFASKPVDSLTLTLAYTYSKFEFDVFVDNNGNNFAGKTLPGIPENLFRGEVAYTHPSGFYAAMDVLSVGDFFADNGNTAVNDSYRVANLRVGVADARFGDWSISPFVGLNNLTDESYASEVRINAFGGRYFEPAPERHFYGGVAIRYNFGQGQL
jgi:iron complex outermembrane receptor protein